jgi:hypothetical protein
MPKQPAVSVGQILVLRSEFEKVANNRLSAMGVARRAEQMVQLLDEVLMWRESAGEETDGRG